MHRGTLLGMIVATVGIALLVAIGYVLVSGGNQSTTFVSFLQAVNLTIAIPIALVSIIVVVLAWRMALAVEKQIEVMVLPELVKQLSSPEMLKQMKTVVSEKESFAAGNQTEDASSAADEVCATFDRIGFILRDHDPLRKKFLEWEGDAVAAQWAAVEPYVAAQRSSPGRKNFGAFLQWMAAEHRRRGKLFLAEGA